MINLNYDEEWHNRKRLEKTEVVKLLRLFVALTPADRSPDEFRPYLTAVAPTPFAMPPTAVPDRLQFTLRLQSARHPRGLSGESQHKMKIKNFNPTELNDLIEIMAFKYKNF